MNSFKESCFSLLEVQMFFLMLQLLHLRKTKCTDKLSQYIKQLFVEAINLQSTIVLGLFFLRSCFKHCASISSGFVADFRPLAFCLCLMMDTKYPVFGRLGRNFCGRSCCVKITEAEEPRVMPTIDQIVVGPSWLSSCIELLEFDE